MSRSRKSIFTERGETARGVVNTLRKNFKITEVKFDGDYCVLNFVRKKRGELIKEDLFVCSGCGVAVEEKPGKVCLNCGQIPGRVRKRNLDNFLEDRVYRR